MVKVENLSFLYGKKQILKDVSFSIHPGEIVGLVAPNGTGKSTLLRNITGLLTPKTGKIQVLEKDSQKEREAFLKQIFFLEDSQRLYEELSAKEHLEYVKEIWQSKFEVEQVLKTLNMLDYAKVRVGKMSLGMKQHVLLGMYLISDAQLLLFDEPLNGLDPTSIEHFTHIFSKLKEQGRSIIMSSHQLANVTEMSDRVFFLKDGTLKIYPTDTIDLKEKYKELFATNEVEAFFDV